MDKKHIAYNLSISFYEQVKLHADKKDMSVNQWCKGVMVNYLNSHPLQRKPATPLEMQKLTKGTEIPPDQI